MNCAEVRELKNDYSDRGGLMRVKSSSEDPTQEFNQVQVQVSNKYSDIKLQIKQQQKKVRLKKTIIIAFIFIIIIKWKCIYFIGLIIFYIVFLFCFF